MSLHDDICRELTAYIGLKDGRVVDYRDIEVQDGYCDTCRYEYIALEVTVVDDEGNRSTRTVDEFTLSGFLHYVTPENPSGQ